MIKIIVDILLFIYSVSVLSSYLLAEPATDGAIINAVSTPTTVTVYWFDAPDSTVAYQVNGYFVL